MGIDAKPLSAPHYLRFCPECIDTMEKADQDLHWKRVHQLAIVVLCPEHGCDLRLSSVAPHPAEKMQHPATHANCASDAPTSVPPGVEVDREALLELARSARTLLNGRYPDNATREKAGARAQFLRDLGYRRSSRLDWEMLQPEAQKAVFGIAPVMRGLNRAGARDDGWFDDAMDPRKTGRSNRVVIAALLIDRVEAAEPSGRNPTLGSHGYNGSYRPSSCRSRSRRQTLQAASRLPPQLRTLKAREMTGGWRHSSRCDHRGLFSPLSVLLLPHSASRTLCLIQISGSGASAVSWEH